MLSLLSCSRVILIGLLTFPFRLSNHEDHVTLVVGPLKAKIKCHRALLGYFSAFFDKALYGEFAEGRPDAVTMDLPDDEEQHVRAFVRWTYTGDVSESFPQTHEVWSPGGIFDETHVALEKLWIFADKILAPKFANDVMHFVLMKYSCSTLPPAAAQSIFEESPPGSKLRMFAVKFIQGRGTLRDISSDSEDVRQDWLALLAKGGDLVTDVFLAGGFRDSTDFKDVFLEEFPHSLDFLQVEGKVTAMEWSQKKAYRGDKSERL